MERRKESYDKKEILNEPLIIGTLLKISIIVLIFITTMIALSIYAADNIVAGHKYNSLWHLADFTTSNKGIHLACMILVFAYVINIGIFIGAFIALLKKKSKFIYISVFVNFCLQVIITFFSIKYKFISGGKIAALVINYIFSIGSMVILFFYQKKFKAICEPEVEKEEKEDDEVNFKVAKIVILIIDIVSILALLCVFFFPLFSYADKNGYMKSFWLVQALADNVKNVGFQLAFLGVLLAFLAVLCYFINSLSLFSKYEKHFISKSNSLIYSVFFILLVYFITGFLISFAYNLNETQASTISYIPLIIMTAILLAYSIIRGKYGFVDKKKLEGNKRISFEPLIYLAVMTVICFFTLFIKVIEVSFEYAGETYEASVKGLELLQKYVDYGSTYQLYAFIIFAILTISIVLLIVCSCSYFAKYKDYRKMARLSIYINFVLILALGLSGVYFTIAQKINEDNIKILIANSENGSILQFFDIEYVSEMSSQTVFLFVGAIIVFVVAVFRGQLDLEEQTIEQNISIGEGITGIAESKEEGEPTDSKDFDACPVFTEIDRKKPIFDAELKEKEEQRFSNLTLPALVKYVVDYAKESNKHLSYTHEDIATFVAGLGASRLSILQGMSGTGKTSLPKIFCEALFGNCEIVEVESSWRDKNELIGYYNEFSKSFSPKKFTQCLYKAKLNPNVITFIVLDEMNLSRIEYYFSDFLSLMEHEEDKREIRLLNVKLQRVEKNRKYDYLALEEGHTIKIPTNVWFIGTANRDESTFEISDKVYDRAQTMNFNKRASKIRTFTEPLPQKYVSYADFKKLLDDAIANDKFEAEDSKIIVEVEKILKPFHISFGNRVLKQIEDFVKIYCACFSVGKGVLKEAVEKIILSKVVSKLEFKNVDNKEELVDAFNQLNLFACSEFVSRLNED